MKEINPFIKEHKLKLIEGFSTEYRTSTSNFPKDGIFTNVTAIETVSKTFHFEQQEKVSIYKVPYINGMLEELSDTACKLFLYIVYHLPKDQDFVNLKQDYTSKKLGVSKPTLIKSIKNLADNAFLRRKSQSEYWINPYLFFHGDRIQYYKARGDEFVEVVAKIDFNKRK